MADLGQNGETSIRLPSGDRIINGSNEDTTDKDFSAYYDIVEDIYSVSDIEGFFKHNRYYDTYDISSKLFNYPYHLLDYVDPHVNKKVDLGRIFLERMSGPARILYITPGQPYYMPNEKKETKAAMLRYLNTLSSSDGTSLKELKDVLSQENSDGLMGRYFDFRNAYPVYMQYVNGLCRAFAVYLGIGDELGPDNQTKLKYYDWRNYRYNSEQGSYKATTIFNNDPDIYLTDLFEAETNATGSKVEELVIKYDIEAIRDIMFSNWQSILFYMDVNSTVQESMSNNTMDSSLKSAFDNISSTMKEASFLAGVGGIATDKYNEYMSSASEKIDELFKNKQGILGRLAGNMSTLLQGNQMVFPSMWESFNFDKTYSLTFNLYSPYGDTKSASLDVWVPLFHLLALTLPRMSSGNPNSLASPFLTRCYCPGLFNCDMGIVSSLIIDKSEGLNINNLPARIRVTMYLKDLYTDLSMSPANKVVDFFRNDSMLDFLQVAAGLNIYTPLALKKIEMIQTLLTNKVRDIPTNIATSMLQNVRNVVDKLFIGR